ncbi:MAG TPA: Spy/CpxP family protein refolding chaperone [Pseudoduganella sp.]
MKKTKQNLPRLLLAAAMALPLGAYAAEDAPPMPGFGPGGPGGPGGSDGLSAPGGLGGPGGPGGTAGPGAAGPGAPGIQAPMMDGEGMPPRPGFDGPRGRFDGPGRVGPGAFGHSAGFLRGIELSEAQEDKIFTILHGQAPYLREQHKAEEKAMRGLHELRDAAKFDDGAASRLAQAAAQARANIVLAEIRIHQKVLAVLTPEQRKALDERKPRSGGI